MKRSPTDFVSPPGNGCSGLTDCSNMNNSNVSVSQTTMLGRRTLPVLTLATGLHRLQQLQRLLRELTSL